MNRSVKETQALLNGAADGSDERMTDGRTAEEVRARLRSLGARSRMPLNRLIDRAANRKEDESGSSDLTLETLRARLAA
jgi:hypothetical protein